MAEAAAPIIIVKKKVGGHGHHGGAWKVAYADFVTAMMALFMVLWLLNAGPKVKEAVGAYFRDPTGKGKQTGSSAVGQGGASIGVSKNDMNKIKEELKNAMKQMSEFKVLKDHVSMTVTGEGLRIELLETEKGLFFESGRVDPSRNGEELLVLMAHELSKLPNNILIEGHTDSKPLKSADGYSNWELSVDRANEARKIMEGSGLRQGQIVQVRGFADRKPRVIEDPANDSNRRVSIIVQYLEPQHAEKPAAEAAKAEGGGHGEPAKPEGESHGGSVPAKAPAHH
ncbi:MAG: OmpA family protein [Bryobacterales bacterium]|nr:OmpA family protein [Bryobacterales bacterium]